MQSHLGKPVTLVALARELARCLPVTHNRRATDQYQPLDVAFEQPRQKLPGDLDERYRDRKGQLFADMRETLNDDPSGVDWDELASELHKLAGVAANFGEAALGDASRRLERRLRQTHEPHLRLEALRLEWPCFEDAA